MIIRGVAGRTTNRYPTRHGFAAFDLPFRHLRLVVALLPCHPTGRRAEIHAALW